MLISALEVLLVLLDVGNLGALVVGDGSRKTMRRFVEGQRYVDMKCAHGLIEMRVGLRKGGSGYVNLSSFLPVSTCSSQI